MTPGLYWISGGDEGPETPVVEVVAGVDAAPMLRRGRPGAVVVPLAELEPKAIRCRPTFADPLVRSCKRRPGEIGRVPAMRGGRPSWYFLSCPLCGHHQNLVLAAPDVREDADGLVDMPATICTWPTCGRHLAVAGGEYVVSAH